MLKVAHRINTIEELEATPTNYGVELDIRYQGDELILHHDPFTPGESFDKYLEHYKHRLVILNTKSEGMELRILELMKKHNIKNYFFLDLSLPFLVKNMNAGEKNIAIRFSEYEPLSFVEKFAGKVDWVWVDCFNDLILDQNSYEILKKDFKICLVSPELQRKPIEQIAEFKKRLEGMEIDAVCTKKPELW